MTKKLSKRSQYTRDFEYGPPPTLDFWHSQMSEDYSLARLGNLDELLDRLGKYDKTDLPLNHDAAMRAIKHFLDPIKNSDFVRREDAFQQLNKLSSVGFGARTKGIVSRNDPQMRTYCDQYVDLCMQTPHQCLISASQKDEMRAFERSKKTGKMELKTPRLFMSYPVEHTYLAVIVLGDLTRQLHLNTFCTTGSVSAVGDSMQGGAMAHYKREFYKRLYKYCTDTSGQDASVSAEFMHLVYDEIRTKFHLTFEEDNLFQTMRINSIDKVVNVNGQVYSVPRGLASGDYLTIIINMMWRLYLIFDNYKRDLDQYYKHNTTIICGDDLVMSSDYDDLDLSSRHAEIKWAGGPVSWDEMDFCSLRFTPYIHHDVKKVRAVLDGRRKIIHQGDPQMEMSRLGGLLRVLTDYPTHCEITKRMETLRDRHNLCEEFDSLWIPYETLFAVYNIDNVYH
jgi:hypothetical protein